MRATFAVAPKALPLIGHALPLRNNPLEFLGSLSSCADLVELRIGPRKVYLPTHPELVWQVLVDGKTYDKGGPVFREARDVLGNGLATCDHATHRRQRLLMQPSFHGDRLTRYGTMMTEVVRAALNTWKDGETLDITTQMMLITTRIAALTLASITMDGPAAREMLDVYSTITHVAYMRIVSPTRLAEKVPTAENRRYWHAQKRLNEVVGETIKQYQLSGVDYGDIMSSLLAASDDTGGLSQKELYEQITILLTGEIETTGAALAWALHLLSRNPDVEARLQHEADDVLAGRTATWDDVPNLTYTKRVLTEVMRVYPPVWFLTRTTTRDVELGGRPIPAGSDVLFCPYVVHRHPDYYPEPENFDPDRWLPGNHEQLPRGAYVPFAAGARKCIGDHFALGEAAIALASISAHWQLERVSDAPVRPVPRSILRPHSLPMRARRRQPAGLPTAAPNGHRVPTVR